MKKLFSTVLVLAIATQLFGCSGSNEGTTATTASKATTASQTTTETEATTTEATTTETEATSETETTTTAEKKEQKTAKFSIKEAGALAGYLIDELGALEADSESITMDMLKQGVFVENDKTFSLPNVVIKDDVLQKPIANSMPFLADLPELYWIKGSAAFRGVRDYDLVNCITYANLTYNSVESDPSVGTYPSGQEYSVPAVDSDVFVTCVNYYVFAEKDDALECFKSFVKKAYEKEENYSDLVNMISGKTAKELYDEIYTTKTIDTNVSNQLYHWLPSMDQEVKINSRKSYKLEELPSDVYELDEANYTGHLTYRYNKMWYETADIWKTVEEPGYVTLQYENKLFSIELQGSVLVFVEYMDCFQEAACPTFYCDEWVEIQFPDNKTIKSICNDFGLMNPYDLSFDADQNDQFFFMERNSSGNGHLVCSELYRRKK